MVKVRGDRLWFAGGAGPDTYILEKGATAWIPGPNHPFNLLDWSLYQDSKLVAISTDEVGMRRNQNATPIFAAKLTYPRLKKCSIFFLQF